MVQARNLSRLEGRTCRALLVSLLYGLCGARAQAIQLEPLPSSEGWAGSQFVQADRSGHTFVLRADRLEAYPVQKSGALGKPVQLETRGTGIGFVREAAMSPAGDRWLLLDGTSVRLFVDGKERVLPPVSWKPWSLTLLRDVPVLGVVPFPMGGRSVDLKRLGTPPWLLHLDSDRWSATRELKGVSVPDLLETGGLNAEIAKNAAVLTADRQGRLWVALQYAYRVQRMTSSGRQLLEIAVDRGELRQKEQDKGIEVTFRNGPGSNDAARRPEKRQKGSYFAFTAERVVHGCTEGRDGRFYLLVSPGNGQAALDRYDPTRSVLERIPVALNLEQGSFSVAAGRDGLYIAAWKADGGRWRVSWEELEAARWKPVQGAKIDDLEPQGDAGPRKPGSPAAKPGKPGA